MSESKSRSNVEPVDDNTIPPEFDPAGESGVQSPPRTVVGTLRQLGPGLIIAGSIVGSGELIATTKTGAQAGISLQWLIILGCLIKVFVQIELGRISITHGETTLATLNRVPGKIGTVNWILWFWLAMMAASIVQLGGIVGGVGQSMAISFPITGDYLSAIQTPSASQLNSYLKWDEPLHSSWDLRLLDATSSGTDASNAGAADEGVGNQTPSRNHPQELTPVGYLDARIADWIQQHQQQTTTWLATLPQATQEELWSLYHAAFPAKTTESPQVLEGHRQKLRSLLTRLNVGRLPAEMNAEEATRLERGHLILADEMTVTSLRQPWQQLVRQLVSQSLVNEAAADVKSAAADSQEQLLATQELQRAKDRVASLTEPATWDDKWWAAMVTFLTIPMLYNGRYGVVQHLSTAFVVVFTFITLGNVAALQGTEQWRISGETLMRGLMFRLPESGHGLTIALATFGIIGVGATELISYPYWCIEKGYARYTGWRTNDAAWAERARGWMRVMHWDAFVSMLIYTVATVAFYLMGVAVLHSEGRDPDGMRMVSTLATAYVPVFGEYAKDLFLVGAFAVLYSTFLIANAGHARVFTDALKVFGVIDRHNQQVHDKWVSILCVALPLICLLIFWSGINPVTAVAFAGVMQATMLPMIGFAALYARWTSTDPRLAPPKWWDVMLWVSFLGLLVVGVYGVWTQISK